MSGPELPGLTAQRRYLAFCTGIYWLRLRFPFSVTSWGRTPEHNAALGDAAKASQHLEFTAVDIEFDQGAAPNAGAFVAAAREHGLEVVREGDHWHLELFTKAF